MSKSKSDACRTKNIKLFHYLKLSTLSDIAERPKNTWQHHKGFIRTSDFPINLWKTCCLTETIPDNIFFLSLEVDKQQKHTTNSPVVRQQAIAQDEPSPLVSLDVISPFEEPAFIGVPRSRGGRFGLRHHDSPWLHSVWRGSGWTQRVKKLVDTFTWVIHTLICHDGTWNVYIHTQVVLFPT